MAILLVLLGEYAGAQSQPPTARPSVAPQSPQDDATAKDASPDRQDAPVTTFSSENATQQPEQANPQDREPAPNWWDLFTDTAANWTIAVLTVVLAILAALEWRETRTANQHNAVIERAYVDIGFWKFQSNDVGPGRRRVFYRITNTGNTPGRIESFQVTAKIAENIPPDASYDGDSEGLPIGTLVYKGNPRLAAIDFPIRQDQWDPMVARTHMLFIRGRVTYTDRFHSRHHRFFSIYYRHPDEWAIPDGGRNDEIDEG